ncbi:MAG: hypothetical protein AAGJ79_13380, partial [Verrucomicrobiota bacterium]
MSALLFVFCVGAVAFFLASLPKLYDGVAVYEPLPMGKVTEEGRWEVTAINDLFYETETEVFNSREVRNDVIFELDLIQKWDLGSSSQAADLLAERTSAKRIGESGMIRVTSLSPDPWEAAIVANAFGQAYEKRRREDRDLQVKNSIISTNQVLPIIKDQLDKGTAKVLDLKRTLGLGGSLEEKETIESVPGGSVLGVAEDRIQELRLEIGEHQSLLDHVSDLRGAVALLAYEAEFGNVPPGKDEEELMEDWSARLVAKIASDTARMEGFIEKRDELLEEGKARDRTRIEYEEMLKELSLLGDTRKGLEQ